MGWQIQVLQRDLLAQRTWEKANEARLLLRIKPLEVDGAEHKSKMGTCTTQVRPQVRPWISERHVALENDKNEKTAKV